MFSEFSQITVMLYEKVNNNTSNRKDDEFEDEEKKACGSVAFGDRVGALSGSGYGEFRKLCAGE
jgi:hypothetical protein